MTTDQRELSSSNYIWIVVLLLWPVALQLNYLDRQMMAVIAGLDHA